MRYLQSVISYLPSISLFVGGFQDTCKCTPNDPCWPSSPEWSSLNTTLSGALIRSTPPASVCYSNQPNYNEEQCALVRSQWFNSTWHAENPISVDYPIWTNNSCDPIYPNGTSVTGNSNAGKKGCSIGNYPVYAVNATTAEQVSKALKWADEKNIRVVVKATGHSYSGRSLGHASLSIWTHNLRGIQYLPSFTPNSCRLNSTLTAARIAAGHTAVDAQTFLSKYNKTISTGTNPSVGLIGWLTGGGHGPLSSTYGMGADNLLEASIVTPDGEILLANPCQNMDLFYAIRGGGGGTFGVVLEVVVKAFPSPKTTFHQFQLATLGPTITKEYWDMIGFIHAEMPRLKEGRMQGYYYIVGPPTYYVYAFIWVFFLYDKPLGTVERLMDPIERRLHDHPSEFVYLSNITTTDTFFEAWTPRLRNELVANGGSAYGSRLLSPESLADPKITAEVFSSIGPSADAAKPNGIFTNPSLIGHMIGSSDPPSYYPSLISMNPAWRKTLSHLIVVQGFPDSAPRELIDAVYRDITWNKTEALRKLSPETGAYFNEADSYEPEWQKAFFGENYERLRDIKRKYDPRDVLWCRRCVGSEGLVERQDGKLCRVDLL